MAGLMWFDLFVRLRNATRGHGAPAAEYCAKACEPLEQSVVLVAENLPVFERQWAYLHQNLSGRYRVTPLSHEVHAFEHLRSGSPPAMPDGVYIDYGEPVRVEGIYSTVDAVDFYYWNGAFAPSAHELISYASGETRKVESTDYLKPATGLADSETAARDLDVIGKALANLPPLPAGYVHRDELEATLRDELTNNHHLVITLVGRGGIGKTSLALSTLYEIANGERFGTIVWFSARDIDLLPQGPRQVKPDVVSERDMARELAAIAQPAAGAEKGFDAMGFFAAALRDGLPLWDEPSAPTLFVFDNFETVRSAVDVYNWIDNNIREPNKALLTTRFRDFRGDYPVDVRGMSRQEADELARATAERFSVEAWLTPAILDELYEESEGHPYVIKVLIGEAAKTGRPGNVKRIVASREDMLEALFERTYAALSPAAQRVFLTLSSWRSVVPQVAVEAVLLRPDNERMDVSAAVDELETSSLIDVAVSGEDGERFLSVPLVGAVFGKRKLTVSAYKSAIENDISFLQSFGAAQASDVRHGAAPRIQRFFQDVARRVNDDPSRLEQVVPMLELLARQQSYAFLLLSELYEEQADELAAMEACRQYIERHPGDPTGWQRLTGLARRRGAVRDEIQAAVEWAELPNVPLSVASEAAFRVNSYFSRGAAPFDLAEKEVLAERLLAVLGRRLAEADATDCSRAAWLAHGLKDRNRAKSFTRRGIEIDPGNPYLESLSQMLFHKPPSKVLAKVR